MRILNSDSRSRSAVGRIACDFGPASARPRSRPPTTRISAPRGRPRPALRRDGRPRRFARTAPRRRRRWRRRLESFDRDGAAFAVGKEARARRRADVCSAARRHRGARRGICGAASWPGAHPHARARNGWRWACWFLAAAFGLPRFDFWFRLAAFQLAGLLPVLPGVASFRWAAAEPRSRAEKSAPESATRRSPSCSRSTRVRTSSTAPSASSPSWNGPNETRISRVTVEPEIAEHVAHLAVLAFADRQGEPEIRALHAVERRFDRSVMDAVDCDCRRAIRRALPALPIRARARGSAAASRSPAIRARARGRRHW